MSETEKERVAIIQAGCDETVKEDGSGMETEGGAEAIYVQGGSKQTG